MAWVESLYGVHVKFTVLVFILATFVKFWGSDVHIALGCILVLAEGSSVSCRTVARVMSLLCHIAGGSASIIRQGRQVNVALVVHADNVVWGRIEEAEVVELGNFNVFRLIFTTKLWVLFDWVSLFNVVDLNLWLHVRIHVGCILLRRAIVSCHHWSFIVLLRLFTFIFLLWFFILLGDSLCNNDLLFWLLLLNINFIDFCILGFLLILILSQVLWIWFLVILLTVNWRMVIFILVVSFDWRVIFFVMTFLNWWMILI